MNVLKKFTFKNIMLNKKRSIVTIIGIILSTALICTVVGMFSSFQKTMINAIIENTGDYYVIFSDVKEDDIKYLKHNRNVETAGLIQKNGYIKISDGYSALHSYDSESIKDINLKKGRFPKNKNEIVISSVLEEKYQIQDNVLLNIHSDKDIKYDKNGTPILKFEKQEVFNIVGIIDDESKYRYYDTLTDYNLMINKLEDFSGIANVRVKYKNIKDTYKLTKELNTKNYSVEYNTELLRWSLVSSSETNTETIYMLLAVVIGIIILSSVFVIRNSFAISTTEKMKQFGILSSIGATKKQIKKSVIYEGLILGVIGIPLGILLGIVVINILIVFSNTILGDMINEMTFVVDIPLLAILFSILLGMVTIYFSSIASAYRASKVSPIEALRNTNEIKIKKRKLKTPKLIKKLFGIGGDIAYKNLKRNNKKYRTTVISLVVSIAIFISLSAFIYYGFNITNVYYKEMPYNITVRLTGEEESEISNKIIKLNDIDSYSIKRLQTINLDIKYLNEDGMKYIDYIGQDGMFGMPMVSIGEKNYKKYIKKLNLKYDDVKDKIIYVKNSLYIEDNKILELYNFDKNMTGIIENKKYNLEIVKTTKKDSYGLFEYAYGQGAFLISDYLMDQIGNQNIDKIDINSSNPDKLEETINKLNYEDLYVDNIDAMAKQMNNMVTWISVFLYGFIIVISLIGVTNVFNTITTNMNLRSKEFAMLKSIGMTNHEFNRMIRLESILYGVKSLFIGCFIGIGISYVIYKALSNSVDFGFRLPIEAIMISILFILLVVGLIMKYSLNKINKQNIIETIRKDNI